MKTIVRMTIVFALSFVNFTDLYSSALPAAEREQVVKEIAAIVETRYAVAEVGARMAARLREQLEAGVYNSLSLQALAEKVDHDLKSVANDQHMMLFYSSKTLSPDYGKNESITDPPADSDEAKFRNDGITRIERLAGNVGYLKLDQFYPPDQAADTISAAMNAINSTDALIVDLSENIGGHPKTVAFLCSYFFAERKHLNDIVDRQNKRTTPSGLTRMSPANGISASRSTCW